ncbi:MAG: MauE/DoxX family redox-associated membrane protein [Myxococcales bacterium]|nr:hypothetical protein [Myxococcales bacterium]HIK85370.1 hypothetical protein [Myxococcales bacterium]
MDPVLNWILRCDLALLFAVAAAHKLSDLSTFVQTLRDYRVLLGSLAPPAAAVVILAEIGITAELLIASDIRPVAGAAIALLCVYSFSIAINLARGRREIDCGCLGPSKRSPISNALLFRNAALAFAAALIMIPVSSRSLHLVDVLTIAGGLAATALVFMASQQLAALTAMARIRRTAHD